MTQTLTFDELPPGAQIGIPTTDRGVISGTAQNAFQTAAMLQATWFVDPTNGNDANPGTQALPLKTDAERQRRMGPWPIWSLSEYHLRYLSDPPATDPIQLTGTFSNTGGNIFIHSSATNGQGKAVLATLAVDALTAVVHSTNTPLQITSNAIVTSWTADGLLNQRCRFTSGANIGGLVWPTLDLTGKKAQMSECQPAVTFQSPMVFATATFAPALNDTFVVESLTALNVQINMTGNGNSLLNSVIFDSVTLTTLRVVGSVGVYMQGCDYVDTGLFMNPCRPATVQGTRFRANSKMWFPSSFTVANCYADDSASNPVLLLTVSSGALIRFVTVQRQGVRILALSPLQFGFVKSWNMQSGLGIFNNSAGPGAEVSGASCNASQEVWGVCGAGGTPFQLQPGNFLYYRALPPGNAGLYFINVAAAPGGAWISYIRAQAVTTTAPTFDVATQTFTTYRALTPALLQATIAGGGVNGQWVDPLSGCGMAAI
jgi:hypothetical protein